MKLLRKKKKMKAYLGLASGIAVGAALGFGLCVADEMKKLKEKQQEQKSEDQPIVSE